jgi:hypothetical protein
MKKNIIYLGFALAIIFASCNPSKNNDEKLAEKPSSEEVKSVENTKKSQGKYGIKSGIVEYKSNALGMDQTIIITFDDFGNKEVTDTYTEVMGIKDHARTIIKEGYAYNLNMAEKRYTKVKMMGNSNENMDFLNMGEDMVKKMNFKQLGKEKIIGKECDKHSIDYKEMSMKGTYWIWNGIALKSDITTMGMKVLMEAVKIDENPSIDASKFEVPKEFKEIKNPLNS